MDAGLAAALSELEHISLFKSQQRFVLKDLLSFQLTWEEFS